MSFDKSLPAGELDDAVKFKILISGASGSGKTTMAARFKRPFIATFELQGIPAIQHANPNAVVFHNSEGRPGVQSIGDIAELVNMIADPRMQEFDAFILDSATDMMDKFKDHFEKKYPNDGDGFKRWGAIMDKTQSVLRKVRDMPTHALVTALDVEVEDGNRIVHRPALYGKSSGFPQKIPKFFNLVGYAYKKMSDNGPQHSVMFSGPDKYLTKSFPGMDTVEPAEPQEWLRKLVGIEVDFDAQERIDAWHGSRESK